MGGVLDQERGFLVLTGMPRPVLGESSTTFIKDFAIFPPHQKKTKKPSLKRNSFYNVVKFQFFQEILVTVNNYILFKCKSP